MPELPDVECFRTLVQRHFINQPVAGIAVSDPASLEGTTGAALQRELKGRSIRSSGRHGKYLFLNFDEHTVIVMHFGPAGALHWVTEGEQELPYVRFRIDFTNKNGLAYVNRRRIGRVRLIDSVASFVRKTRLGPDALDKDFSFADFAGLLANRDQPIKSLLMDQTKIAGIGNTWSDEILFHARIRPTVAAGALEQNQQRELFNSIRNVFKTAIRLDPTANDSDAASTGFPAAAPSPRRALSDLRHGTPARSHQRPYRDILSASPAMIVERGSSNISHERASERQGTARALPR
jgi:formamidopyrimidine-DNA glycosylase